MSQKTTSQLVRLALGLLAASALAAGCEGTAIVSEDGQIFPRQGESPTPPTGTGGIAGAGGTSGTGGSGGTGSGGSSSQGGTGGGLTPRSDDPVTAFEDEVLTLVNQHRAAGATCGSTSKPAVPPLSMNESLRLIARAHSIDMATRDFFDHNNPEGKSPFQRMKDAGYKGAQPWGENIAAGQSTPAQVVDGWMHSPGHCGNIMGAGYKQIGIGYSKSSTAEYGHYWTQNFSG